MNLRPITDRCSFYREDLMRLGEWVRASPDSETGGDLFGNWSHVGNPVVQGLIGSGPLARCGGTYYYQDASFLRAEASERARQHGLQHIGQWHSHHRLGLEEPSRHDTETVAKALASHRIPAFLLIIATLAESPRQPTGKRGKPFLPASSRDPVEVKLHPFLYFPDQSKPRPLSIVVLGGQSPFANTASPANDRSAAVTLAGVSFPRIEWDAPLPGWAPQWPAGSFAANPTNRLALAELTKAAASEGWEIQMQGMPDASILLSFADSKGQTSTCTLPAGFPQTPPIWSSQPPPPSIEILLRNLTSKGINRRVHH